MNMLISAWTLGLILSLLSLGVYITFRIFRFPDITADGSITLGASVAAVMLTLREPLDPFTASLIGFLAGAAAGTVTGIIHTKFKIDGLLAGILVMTALWSINLRVMGTSNISLISATTLGDYAEGLGNYFIGAPVFNLFGWEVFTEDFFNLVLTAMFVGVVLLLVYLFFRTSIGTSMRATGDNPQMTRALGGDVELNTIIGVALSNGLIGLAGALWAQYQGFADVQMGIGIIVMGLASVIIGEALTGSRSLGLVLTGSVMGMVLFRLVIANALLMPYFTSSDLRLITAIFVFGGLVLPMLIERIKRWSGWNQNRPQSEGSRP
ncbi:MAG: ABC transporter permease [Verrucomicrobiota bacterium]